MVVAMNLASRYAAQTRFHAVGSSGQRRLASARVAIVGLGATGGVIAETLARAGVGALRLIDRDLPEPSNLHRQALYDEATLARHLPKAEAARQRLAAINSEIDLEARVLDLQPGNAQHALADVDLVLDGTDNFSTRFLINDACALHQTPWIYTGVIGVTVHSFTILPGPHPCFRCFLPAAPPPGSTETCDTAGVLGPAVWVAGGLAAAEALKLLLGRSDDAVTDLLILDVWTRESRRVGIPRDPDCPTCRGVYPDLRPAAPRSPAALCGQDAVSLAPPHDQTIDLPALAERLAHAGELPTLNPYLLRFVPHTDPQLTLTVFQDGRGIVHGTRELPTARSLYARYVGL